MGYIEHIWNFTIAITVKYLRLAI